MSTKLPATTKNLTKEHQTMKNQKTNCITTHDSILYNIFNDNEKGVADILLQLPRLMLDQNLTSEFLPWGSKKKRSHINLTPSSSPPPPLQSIPEEHTTLPCNVLKKPKKEDPIEIKAEPLVLEANIPCSSSQPKILPKIKLVVPKRKLPPSLVQIKPEPPNPEPTPCFTDGALGVKPLKPMKKGSLEKTKENLEKGLAELTDNKDNLTEGKRTITIKAEPPSPKAAPSGFTSAALDTKPLKPKRKTCNKKTKEELENQVAKWTENTNDLVKCIDKVKELFENLKAKNLKLKAYKQQLALAQNKAKSDLGGDTNIGPEVKNSTVQPLSHQQIPITPHHQSPPIVNQMAYGPETFGIWQFPCGQTPPLLGFNNDMSMREGLKPFGDTHISLSLQRTLGISFIDQIKETKLTKQ